MADLNIPNLNIKSDKYIFKKKLNLRRKSKRRLFTESFFLFILSVLLVYVNYLILFFEVLFMSYLKTPNFNINSYKFIFKKKLILRIK